jgi:hydrogenase/urease accessory protein HupE
MVKRTVLALGLLLAIASSLKAEVFLKRLQVEFYGGIAAVATESPSKKMLTLCFVAMSAPASLRAFHGFSVPEGASLMIRVIVSIFISPPLFPRSSRIEFLS